MSDYVINYGKPNQWRGTMGVVTVSDGETSRWVATLYNVATDEIVVREQGDTAIQAINAVATTARRVLGTFEPYQRSKHRDLALSKIGKRSYPERGNVLEPIE